MNVSFWLKQASKIISRLDAEIFMMAVFGKSDRSDLVLLADRVLTEEELKMLDMMLELRLRDVPVAYIIGKKEFYGRKFGVSRDVLIPRPETEAIIDVVKELDVDDKVIVDVGTGSGCIAITLALETKAKVIGIDKSMVALRVAQDNAERLGAKVEFMAGDLLSDYRGPEPDIVVANLPYVDREWEWTSPEIQYEPEEALFAEKGGLELIYKLIDQCRAKYLILEADPSQHKKIIKYASKKYSYERRLDFILTFEK
ncbi:peptide chain release factor N(5)-glutamine methyltransferase [Candidatus Saccharibacteria bacterium]|nr:peptide chain release factor N(5)-glutamine methyltransferase [Candidatus Saccharibacteria bacterium]